MSASNHNVASCILRHLNASAKATSSTENLSDGQGQSEQSYEAHETDGTVETAEVPSTMINDYVESLHYINSCHTLLNQIIECRHPAQTINIPQMPNFLNVLTYIAKDVRGLSELKNLEALEGLMQKMSGPATAKAPPRRKSASGMMGRSAQACCSTVDREVEAYRPLHTNVETSTKRLIPEVRFPSTGIPRRIKTKERQVSPSRVCDRIREVPRFERRKSVPMLKKPSQARMKSENMHLHIESNIAEHYPESASPDVDDISDKDSFILSNDELDECAKQILLASEALQSESSNAFASPASGFIRNKVRRVKSKAKRDFVMIQNFLKQWGVGVDVAQGDSDLEGAVSLPPEKSAVRLKCGDLPDTKAAIAKQLPSKHELNIEVESDVDTTIMEGKMRTSRSSRISTDSVHMTVLNDLAAAAVGMESTFITNEEPVWHSTTNSPLGISDESDIEPDLVDHSHKEPHVNNAKSKCAKTVTFQTNPRAAYVVRQKSRDLFLLPRRRRSQSDLDGEQGLVDSDIDDEIFDRKRRHKNALKLRQPVLPQQVLSNIGILTQTGQVKPEKERHLQEMRSRLASDMQTALFRKPRNRKLETDDIVHLHSDCNNES